MVTPAASILAKQQLNFIGLGHSIHTKIGTNPLNFCPSTQIACKGNDVLCTVVAKVDNKHIHISDAHIFPAGNISFYTKNRHHIKWFMEHKHVWTKEVHLDLGETSSAFFVVVHGILKSKNITNANFSQKLATEDDFDLKSLFIIHWLAENKEGKPKQTGSLVIMFPDTKFGIRL